MRRNQLKIAFWSASRALSHEPARLALVSPVNPAVRRSSRGLMKAQFMHCRVAREEGMLPSSALNLHRILSAPKRIWCCTRVSRTALAEAAVALAE